MRLSYVRMLVIRRVARWLCSLCTEGTILTVARMLLLTWVVELGWLCTGLDLR